MRVLIAGGCGFVGTHLALHLKELGHEVLCIDNMSRRGTEINFKRLSDKGIDPFHNKIQSVANVPKSIQEFGSVDVILNCSAQSRSTLGAEEPGIDFYGNVETTFACLELARHFGACLIHWSTNKVYSSDQVNAWEECEEGTRYGVEEIWDESDMRDGTSGTRSIYGATKLASEVLINEWSQVFDIPVIINRFSCIAGPHQWGCSDQGWVARWVINNYLEKPLQYIGWKGKQVRDVLHINDLCRLIDRQIDSLMGGNNGAHTYTVGGGEFNTLSLLECNTFCEELSGKKSITKAVENPRWADHRVYCSSISRVSKDFDWEPKWCPEETVKSIYRWVIDNEAQVREFYA